MKRPSQNKSRRKKKIELEELFYPAERLRILKCLLENQEKALGLSVIVHLTNSPEAIIQEHLDFLLNARILHRTNNQEGSFYRLRTEWPPVRKLITFLEVWLKHERDWAMLEEITQPEALAILKELMEGKEAIVPDSDYNRDEDFN